jgi:tight adherence protein B
VGLLRSIGIMNILGAVVGASGIALLVLSFSRLVRVSLKKDWDQIEGVQHLPAAARLQRKLEQAGLNVSAGDFVKASFVVGGMLTVAVLLGTGSLLMAVVAFFAGFWLYWAWLERRRDRQVREYQEALPDAVGDLREALAINPSIEEAMTMMAAGGPLPVRSDFELIKRQTAVGVSLAQALKEAAQRRKDMFFDMLVEALLIHNAAGGAIGPTLEHLAEVIRSNLAIRNKQRAEQARPKTEGAIFCLLPPLFLFLVQLMASRYARPFYQSFLGQVVMVVVVLLSAAAYYLLTRIASRGVSFDDVMGDYTPGIKQKRDSTGGEGEKDVPRAADFVVAFGGDR